ncbi:membrane protein [Aureimonas sp. SA4125]|uniref:YjbE family putative metal transport protein n=1 Tax=Aureimonas sp. SA4125 TaxID=2826993 RepID=UPI001CC37ED6|nr:YjbE family putative metal transport protein [Aureimonas sp. SA4125]BDA83282.1 membrane protein [Aureimonas sp. SA4125]
MNEIFWAAEFSALLQVLLIDVALAGDNAIVVGMVAAGVAPAIRARVIFWGIVAAVFLRILLAVVAVQLLEIVGLTLAGGLLLLYVCYRMFREVRQGPTDITAADESVPAKSFGQAIFQIMLADVSMSLDNVLAVAGAARDHVEVLVVGLLISVVLMGAAATLIARLLQRYRSISWIGLAVILFVAVEMIWQGYSEVAQAGILPGLPMPPDLPGAR